MTHSFTTQEIVDILIQKPDRKTAGLLDHLSAFERIENTSLISYRHSKYADFLVDVHRNANSPLPIKAKLFMVFEKEAKAWCASANDEVQIQESKEGRDHPRSLKQALLELKAAGFSHRQIYFLAIFARGVLSSYYHGDYSDSLNYRKAIAKELEVDLKSMQYRNNDEGFLGGQIMVKPQSGEGWAATDHSMLPKGYEERVEDKMIRHFSELVQRHSNLFTPQNHRKARRLRKA
jgi:hypothetical protein